MPNSPTIVSAALSDKELQDSINKMVANFDKGLQTMLEHSNEYVGKIQASLQKIGDTNFGAKGSNDGGVAKQTKAQNEFTDAVKKSTNEIKRQGKETAMSFDQIAAAQQKAIQSQGDNTLKKSFNRQELQQYIDRLRELQAEYIKVNTRQGGGVKSDKIKADIHNLEEIIAKYREILKNLDYVNSRQGTVDVKKWVQDLGAVDDRYKKLVRWYTVLEKEDQRRIASEEKANQKRLADLEKEKAAQDKVIKSYQDSVLKAKLGDVMKLPTSNIDEIRAKFERLRTIIANIRELGILSPKEISAADSEVKKLGASIQRYEKFEQERIAAEQKFIVEQAKEVEQTQTLEGRVKGLAQAIRERLKEEGRFVDMQAYGKDLRVYAENDSRAKGLTIEQQILQQLEAEQRVIQQQVSTSQQLNGERKKYVSPTINDDAYQTTRNAIARKLGINTSDVINADAQYDSIKRVNSALKQLQDAYTRMSNGERNSPVGKQMIRQMQELERQTQQLRAQMSRPISLKDAMGLSEKTLDDIAYKMQRLRAYKQGIDLTKPNSANEIKQVDEALARLQKDADKWMSKSNEMIKSNTALGRSWNYMKNRLAFYVTVGAGTSFIKQLVDIRSQYEMNEKALGILLDSASRGTRIFNELSQMALVSPYTLIELSNAAKQLTAYDIAAKDVVDTTRRLADMASAVGVPVERLTYALGQIKAYGYLNSRDARMFANAGIPLVKQLADRYSELEGKMVSTADVYDRMKKKAIDYNDVMAVINKMTDEGGKFFDFQAKMAETLKVRLANLTLAWNNMLNDMGKDNQGWFSSGLKGLTTVFKHWRELYRIISTVIVAIGAYKTASMVAGIAASRAVSSTIPAWFRLASIVRTTQGNIALLGLTMRSIPFTAWVTAIATLASYFILFNNSSDDVKQKLEDIKSAFDGVRKEVETLFADAIKTDNIGTQLTKLRDILELAETELGVTIPIRLEDVNESNIKQKLKEAKQFVDEYINFSQTFSEAAAGTKFNELMNDFGSKARSTYTNVTESINSVIVALQELSDKGQASKRDIEILNELTSGQKEDESRIEYLQRLISLYEELGLIGQKKVEPMIEHNFFKAYFTSTWDNMEELEQEQEKNLDRLGIKNKSVFENMLKDVQEYYSSSSIAAYQLEQQVMRVAEKIDIKNIPVEQRTMKLTAAINEEASQNNWNQFEKEFARQIANEKFGTTIEISDESKGVAEQDLKDWQKKQQEWAVKNGITIPINFQTNDTEVSYEKRMLQEAKDAAEEYQTQLRKLERGTGSQDAVDEALKSKNEARQKYFAAGGDMSLLDKKENAARKKAIKEAESELQKALKEELSTIDKVRSIYKDLTKEGMSHANAVERATRGWDETVNAINRVLRKNGLQKLDLSKFAGIENPRELVNMLQSQLNVLLKRGAKPAEIKELQTKVNTLEVDADKYDLTKITKGLNNKLDMLKEEYELAVELDANPEMGNLFADWMGFDMSTLPHTAEEYAKRMTKALNEYLADEKSGIEIRDLLALTDDDLRMFQQRVDNKELNQVWVDNIVKKTKEARNALKKENSGIAKEWDSLIQKYSEYEYKIAQVQRNANKERKAFALKYGTNDQKERALVLTTEIDAEEDQAKKQELINQLKQLLTEIAGDDDSKLKIPATIDKKELEEGAKISFEEFQKSPEWIVATGDLAGMTNKAIGGLINSLESYKKKAKNLDGKQIKNINNALRKLYKQQREGNPFLVISNAIDQAKARMKDIQPALDSTMSDIIKLEKEIGDTKPTEEQAKALDELKKKWKELYEVGQLSASDIVSGINSAIDVAVKASESFNKMAEALGGTNMAKAAKTISDITGNLQAAGQGAAAGAQISGGNGWAAAAGATVGGLTDLVTRFAEQWSGNKSQTERVKEVEDSVGELELAYIDLEHAVDKAMGTAVLGAKQAALANKQAQLESIKRQLELEKERDSKYRDSEKILSLEKQYKELFNEIQDGYTELVDTIMGTDVSSFAENLVSSMITAFKQGEDYMKVFSDKFDEMIDNMIMKSIVSRVVSSYLNKIWDAVDERINNRAKEEREAYKKTQEFSANTDVLSDDERRWNLAWVRAHEKRGNDASLWDARREYDSITEDDIKKYVEAVKAEEKAAKTRLEAATEFTDSDIDFVMSEINETMPELGEKLKDILGQYYKFGESSDKNLSSLQQGLQSMSEDTGSALESYMNGVSQQVYYHSSLLEQIRDSVVGLDLDVSLGVQSQMLLQLQNSYQTQQAIQQILEGVLVPSGRAFAVELMS